MTLDIGKRFAGEGSECSCDGGEHGEHHKSLVMNVDASYVLDAQRRRNAPTSETMRNKALAHTSTTNGHDTRRPITI